MNTNYRRTMIVSLITSLSLAISGDINAESMSSSQMRAEAIDKNTVNSNVSHHMPAELLYKGRPIDSLCFENIKNNKIDLRYCGWQNEKYIVKQGDSLLNKKGYTGYDWENPNMPGIQGYSYYQFFKGATYGYWIYTVNSGGGSGEFTTLLLAHRIDTQTVGIKPIAQGDRCNGGIQNVATRDSTLTFSVNLTAYDLITLAQTKLPNLKAYDDLAACAICCVAKAYYRVDVSDPIFNYVELIKVSEIDEMPSQGIYQICLNRLLMAKINETGNHLTQDKINNLANEFIKKCLPDKK